MKDRIKSNLRRFEFGDKLIMNSKHLLNKLPKIDTEFPELIGIAVCSYCNLNCVHCPPQSKQNKKNHSFMTFDLFKK